MSCAVRALPSSDPLAEPSLARELATRHFVFDAHVAGNRRVDLHPLVLSRELHRRAYDAAARVSALVSHSASRAMDDHDEAARYGLPPDAITLATSSYEARDRSRLWRVDLLLGEDGDFHACEVNADCPGGLNEAIGLPRLARAAGVRGDLHDPTRVVHGLVSRLESLASKRGGAVALLYATGYAEDLQVCALLQRELEARGVHAVLCAATAPAYWDDELWVKDDRISALYRFFPIEAMEGQRNVPDLAWAVRTGRVRAMSSFACAFAQSKVSLARAHALGEDREALGRVPFTCDAREIERGDPRERWVLKKGLGRVGEDVIVGALSSEAEWREAVEIVRAECDAGTPWIAQRYVPQRSIDTPWGPRLLTLGVYVLDGSPIGYFGRLTTRSLATHDALCLPVFVGDA